METARSTIAARPAQPAALSPRSLGPVLSFLRSLWGLNHALESASRRMKVRFGVTGPERMVVRLAGRYPGISAGDLARILRVHPSTLTGLLKRLVRRGVLVRRPDPADARRALFTLTARGRAVDRLRSGTVEAAVRVALASLPAREVRAAATVLDALARSMDRWPSPAAPLGAPGAAGPSARSARRRRPRRAPPS
jgi:DNA-binding MarR family transcriptional regulator